MSVSRGTRKNVSRETYAFMPSDKRKFGDEGENFAQQYLKSKGYKIIERNYLKPWGEIDIVARLKDKIVFCEVKTRDSGSLSVFLPETTINRRKTRHLKNTCETYLTERSIPHNTEWQIDLIYVSNNAKTNEKLISHYENIVWEQNY